MSSELEQPFINELHEEDDEARDWDLLIAFNELRHREKIQGSKKVAQTWRMKERVWTMEGSKYCLFWHKNYRGYKLPHILLICCNTVFLCYCIFD